VSRSPSPPVPDNGLRPWRRASLVAIVVIALAIPLAYARFLVDRPPVLDETPTFVGRETCRECHQRAADAWRGSYHDRAMAEANDQTVLGNFDNATFDYFGVVSRFFKKDDAYYVNTQGPDGVMVDYPIAYVFGVWPLQQYLIRFPGGRLQSLTIAWDAVRQRWYHLYPDAYVPPGDWLHWTRNAQNWNGMCADCHSTNLAKGYDADKDTFETRWSEIDVSCEACHGPASQHVKWARLPAMARPAAEDYRLVVSTKGMSAREQVELCAPCHSRRYVLGDYRHAPGTDLLDHLVPSLLEDNLYFPDGQIKDEVYEYASFLQSKMYRMGVRCTDCHDAHSTKRHVEGNDLCTRCHKRDVFDTTAHHFHKPEYEGKPSPGWLCQNCHMPQRAYMGIDERADHSIRIPRPDLSLSLGTPNACTTAGCHADKGDRWAAEATARWYGQARRPHYGTVIAAARRADPSALNALVTLTQDRLSPAIVRATAVSLLARYRAPAATEAIAQALEDEESLVRHAAVEGSDALAPADRIRRLSPLLQDPVKAVRAAAARALAETPGFAPGRDDTDEAPRFRSALAEFEAAMRHLLDFASSGFNLGNLYGAQGRFADAERYYRVALRIDPLFVRARVNYAMLLAGQGRLTDAERELREAVRAEPKLAEARYNLGLLLAETGRLKEAVVEFERVIRTDPGFARAHYNLALAERDLGRLAAARASLDRALAIEPDNGDVFFALVDLLIRQNRLDEARRTAERWAERQPNDARARDVLTRLRRAGPR